jgi:hypothetical protein
MVPDVQKRLGEGETHTVASQQQVEEAQESEGRGCENDIVEVSSGQHTEDTQDDDDHQHDDEVEGDRQRQTPPGRGRRNGLLRISSRNPAGGNDPDQGDDDDEANLQAIGSVPTE